MLDRLTGSPERKVDFVASVPSTAQRKIAMSKTIPEQNKALVLEAFDTLFNRRDYTAADTIGRTATSNTARILRRPRRSIPPRPYAAQTLRNTKTISLAEGDFVITHGRFSGNGRQAAWVAADIVRMEDGKLAEHWDVLQDEATKAQYRAACRCSAIALPTFRNFNPNKGAEA